MLGAGVHSPSIADVYRCSDQQEAARLLLRGIRTTFLKPLHILTASRELSSLDAQPIERFAKVLQACRLERFYDYVIIDNAPGIDALQKAAMHASDELFVPTELQQFAVDGIVEMQQLIENEFPRGPRISRIIPNFYRNTKRHNSYIAALRSLFGDRVTTTAIVQDTVFDELVTDGKILFLNRLYSKGAQYYLQLMRELFDFSEDSLWDTMVDKRREHMSESARERFYKSRRT
jgi:chromosome partitioning protein